MLLSRTSAKPLAARAGLAALAAALAFGLGWQDISSQAANTIPLSGTAGVVCTINVTPDPNSTNLPITTVGSQTVTVGTVLQTCNHTQGYTLAVSSANCATGTAGAKLIEPVSSSTLPYSVNATNPSTGGSTNTSGLLASVCANQVARDVTNSGVTGETSTMAVVFTGSATLFPGTYTDTLTLTMTTK